MTISIERKYGSDAIDRGANIVTRVLLVAFVLGCVFDPADRILGAKVWVFVALWGGTFATCVWASDRVRLPIDLLLIIAIFVAIPLLSILRYYFVSGTEPYAGFALLKSYLFASLAIVLVVSRFDIVPVLAGALTLVAVLTIAISVLVRLYPWLFLVLHEAGASAGNLILLERSYGQNLTITQVAFATAPMLAISISYHFDRAMDGASRSAKLKSFTWLAVNMIGMFLVGLRNTMAVALLLPFFLWPIYTRRVLRNMGVSLAILVVLSLPLLGKLRTLLNPAELSNDVKLTFLRDYAAIFSNPVDLMFGQGLGAYYRWSSSGQPNFETTGANFYFVTELTYAEMIRSFGLIGALIMLAPLLYPVASAFRAAPGDRRRALAMGFIAYLGMSVTNPLLFSSSGMLIWTVLLADSFRTSCNNSLARSPS
ncbi:hypothetical protein ACFQX9_38045 [Bradyrhizobium sp. GCM10028915]|uniref:hypothetical protein n=1 Tax=Bradyrhizobium sp. GCM10028915 TaxID=3273385 RepID=UPI003616E29B